MSRFGKIAALATPLIIVASLVHAEPVKFEAHVTHKEGIRLDFADASKRFFMLVRREGKTEGQGPLAGATVQEYGDHDVVPGVGGEPHGYLEFVKSDGDKAYVNWTIQAVFVPGPDGKRTRSVGTGRTIKGGLNRAVRPLSYQTSLHVPISGEGP